MFRTRAAAVLIAATMGLAACGGGSDSEGSNDADALADLSPAQLLEKAKSELDGADSVSLAGERASGEQMISIDLDFVGDDATGDVSFGDVGATLLKVDDTPYVTFDDSFYQQIFGAQADAAREKVGDRWIIVDPTDPNFTDLLSFVDRENVLGTILDADGEVTKAEGKTIDGIECLALKSSKGTLYVDKATGHPISIAPLENPEQDVMFSYDDIDTPEAPDADETVSLDELG